MDLRRRSIFYAVENESVSEVKWLLQGNANVNELDTSGNTPLLWAIMHIEDDDLCYDIVKILIKAGADIHVQNAIGYSALLAAVYHEKTKIVELLLREGAWLTPTLPNEIHLLAQRGNKHILALFLNHPRCGVDDVNCADKNNEIPVENAASKGHKECTRMLIDKGADMSHKTPDEVTVMQLIFDHISRPVDFLVDTLDSRITTVLNQANNKREYVVDFALLAPRQCERQMEVLSNMLQAASDEETTEALQHPLIELYLILKWSRICQFFYLWIVIYVIFVLSLWLYVTMLLHGDEGYEVLTTVARVTLILTGSGLLGHAILQYILSYKMAVQKQELWLNIGCTLLSVTVAVAQTEPINVDSTPTWILHAVSIAVLLAWIELMLLIGRLPTYGYYALMFAAVLQNVVKVLLAFLCLLIGFSLSFSIQFHNYEQFKDPWRALVKTTVMMMGEFEYADLFADSTAAPLRLPATSRVIFLMFIILSSIVLMNLMVGLAVSDIQGLQKESHARKLEKQIDFLSQIEKVILSKKLMNSRVLPRFVKGYLERRSHVDTAFTVQSSKQFRRAKGLNCKLVEAIVAIGKRRQDSSI